MVETDVVDLPTGRRDTTNVFSFTFGFNEPLTYANNHADCIMTHIHFCRRTVRPETYREGICHLQGKRSLERSVQQHTGTPPFFFTAPLDA